MDINNQTMASTINSNISGNKFVNAAAAAAGGVSLGIINEFIALRKEIS